MRSDNGFTLIELLIASAILFAAILTANAAFKQYTTYRIKQKKYEKIYISVLSLKDKINSSSLGLFTDRSGNINGLAYEITAKRVESNRNYIYSIEQEASGNKGLFVITLYRVAIHIAGRVFRFYRTEYERE